MTTSIFVAHATFPTRPVQHEEERADLAAHHEPSLYLTGSRPRQGTCAVHLGYGRRCRHGGEWYGIPVV